MLRVYRNRSLTGQLLEMINFTSRLSPGETEDATKNGRHKAAPELIVRLCVFAPSWQVAVSNWRWTQ